LDVTKAESQALRVTLSQAKGYSAVQGIMGISSGQEEFQQILDALGANPPREHRMIIDTSSVVDSDEEKKIITPDGTQNPEPPGSGAPFLPNDGNFLSKIGHDAMTPTPTEAPPAHI
jgi:tRNA-dihydrouridine synthase 2